MARGVLLIAKIVIKSFLKKFALPAAIIALSALPASAFAAAKVYLSPSSGSFRAGETFSASLYVSTDQAMNAASVELSFSPADLEVLSISKSGIINVWAQEPAFSNSKGTVSIEGVVLNPGYTGTKGKIASITIRPKREATTKLRIQSATVMANDGLGTALTTSTEGAVYSILPALKPAEKPDGTRAEPEKQVTKELEILMAPTLASLKKNYSSGEAVFLKGRTYPNASVKITVFKGDEAVISSLAVSDQSGHFSAGFDPLPEGSYSSYAEIVSYQGAASIPGDRADFKVSLVSPHIKVSSDALYVASFVIGILILVSAYLLVRLAVIKKRIKHSTRRMDTVFKKLAGLSSGSTAEHIRMLEKTEGKRSLTEEEEKLKKHLKSALLREEEEIKEELNGMKHWF